MLSDEYPQMDKNWGFWIGAANPNSHRLTDHDKCVENLLTTSSTIRMRQLCCSNNFSRTTKLPAALLEQLLENHQDTDADEDTQATMVSVFTALQYIATANDSAKAFWPEMEAHGCSV